MRLSVTDLEEMQAAIANARDLESCQGITIKEATIETSEYETFTLVRVDGNYFAEVS